MTTQLSLHVALVHKQNLIQDLFFDHANVRIGSNIDCDFSVQLEVFGNSFALFKESDGEIILRLPKSLHATLCLDGNEFHSEDERKPYILDEKKSIQRIKISKNDWGILEISDNLDIVFCLELSPAAFAAATGIKTTTGVFASLSRFLRSRSSFALAVSLVLHAAFLIATFWFYQEELEVKYAPLSPRWVQIVSTMEEHSEKDEPEKPEEPLPIIEDEDSKIIDDAKEDTQREKLDDTDSKIANLDKVEKPVGIQAALSGSRLFDSGMDSLFGSDVGLGNALDQMVETEDGDAYGTGLGFAPGIGSGRAGGGGYGGGRIGGLGSGAGGSGDGSTGGKLKGPSKSKAKLKPKLDLATSTQGAFCKESNIRDVVQKRSNALRNCYEQQLLADPTLSGKIIVYWKIGLDGTVQQASIKSSTMKNPKVETCLETTIRRLRFDKPDGGICVVEFPFIFSASN